MRALSCLFCLLLIASCSDRQLSEPAQIRLGVIAPITSAIGAGIPKVGQSTLNAAKLAAEEVNQAGGVQMKHGKVKVKLIIEDSKDQAEGAISAARKLINQEGVLAIIGPQASRNAIPASKIAEAAKIPMISPWSTNPETTKGKEFVFRAGFVDTFQGQVMAKFTFQELGIRKAAVLFDEASDYNKGLAQIYKQSFEKLGGQVVAYEAYVTGQKDVSQQLSRIKESGAELVFLPNYYNEVPYQVAQAKKMGLNAIFLGSDTWGNISEDNLPYLEGCYFSAHYSPDIEAAATREFVKKYKNAYGQLPDDVAALTYDAMGLFFLALRNIDDRQMQDASAPQAVRDGLRAIKKYEGVTGTMRYESSGDPVKSAVILQIKDGKPKFYKFAEP